MAKESSSRIASPPTEVVTYRVETFATVIFASGVVNSVEVRTVPSKVKFVLSSISPLVPARTTLPEVKSEILAVAIVASVVIYAVAIFATVTLASGVVTSVEVKTVPSKVKFVWSSNSPPVPARTTLPEVKSETLAVAMVASVVIYAVLILEVVTLTTPVLTSSDVTVVVPVPTCNVVVYKVAIFATVIFASSMSVLKIVAIVGTYNVATFATVTFASAKANRGDVKTVPSKVKFPLSSSSPEVPARTTLPLVKSEILAVATVASVVT